MSFEECEVMDRTNIICVRLDTWHSEPQATHQYSPDMHHHIITTAVAHKSHNLKQVTGLGLFAKNALVLILEGVHLWRVRSWLPHVSIALFPLTAFCNLHMNSPPLGLPQHIRSPLNATPPVFINSVVHSTRSNGAVWRNRAVSGARTGRHTQLHTH